MEPVTHLLIRPIDADDWPAIAAIQQQCYHALTPEPLSVLQNKWQLSPTSCFVLQLQQVCGYCLAHPWRQFQPPALYSELTPCVDADTLYLHDIAVAPAGRGLGFAAAAVDKLKVLARQRGWQSLSLVAVQGAHHYWQKHGFTVRPLDKSLASYTDDACYMLCPL